MDAKDFHEQISYLAWSACDKVDKMIDLIPPNGDPDQPQRFIDVHDSINRVRAHMEARSMQTATPVMLPVVNAAGDGYEPHKGPPVEPKLFDGAALCGELLPARYAALAADAEKLAALLGAENVPAISAQDAELNALLGL
jgi:hypothetical protein